MGTEPRRNPARPCQPGCCLPGPAGEALPTAKLLGGIAAAGTTMPGGLEGGGSAAEELCSISCGEKTQAVSLQRQQQHTATPLPSPGRTSSEAAAASRHGHGAGGVDERETWHSSHGTASRGEREEQSRRAKKEFLQFSLQIAGAWCLDWKQLMEQCQRPGQAPGLPLPSQSETQIRNGRTLA